MNAYPDSTTLDFRGNGAYFQGSAVIQSGFTFAEVRAARDLLEVPVDTAHDGYLSHKSRDDLELLALDPILPLLVDGHEQFHHTQTATTPFGLLIWRTMSCIADDVEYLVSLVENAAGDLRIEGPLLTWLDASVQAHVVSTQQTVPANARPAGSLDDYREHVARSLPYCIEGVDTLLNFLTALQDDAGLTMREFVDLANKAYGYMAGRCGLTEFPVWSSQILDHETYLPGRGPTGVETIEAGARLWEVRKLRSMNTRSELLEQWRSRYIFDVYKPAFDLLEQSVGLPHASLILADMALLGPVDLAQGAGTVFVETCLPGWRLHRVVAGSRDLIWPTDRAGRTHFQEEAIPERAGLAPTSEALARLSQNPLNDDARGWFSGLPVEIGGPGATVATNYRRHMLAEFKRAFELRVRDPLAFVEPTVPELFQPVVTFYEEDAVAHPGPTANLDALLGAYNELVTHSICFALLADGDIARLRPIEAAMRRLIASIVADLPDSATPEDIDRWTSVRSRIRPPAEAALRF